MRPLMIAAHDKAIRTNRVDRDMASQLQTVLDEHHQSMVVHGYKEQSHLLKASVWRCRSRCSNTKLAGYLVHPISMPTRWNGRRRISLTCISRNSPRARRKARLISTSRTIVRSGMTTSFRAILRLLVLLARKLAIHWISVSSSHCLNLWRFQYPVCCMAWSMPVRKSI